jgi:hypothetical protein
MLAAGVHPIDHDFGRFGMAGMVTMYTTVYMRERILFG